VTQAEIRATFSDGWEVRWIREERFENRIAGVQGRAWLAALRRADGKPPPVDRGRLRNLRGTAPSRSGAPGSVAGILRPAHLGRTARSTQANVQISEMR
jgi:hypothetical protein